MRPLEAILIAGAIALFFVANAKDAPLGDSWSAGRGHDSRHAHFTIVRRSGDGHMRMSFDVPWERLKGLTPEMLGRTGDVKFEYAGDAGSLLCEGQTQLVRGAHGKFTFRANPAFAEELKKLGYGGEIGDRQLFSLTIHGVALDLAKALPAPGTPTTVADLEQVAIHGIDAKYLNEVRAAGYPQLVARDFVEAKIHGVTPEYLSAIKSAGYDLPMDRMVQLRIHGVSVPYLKDLQAQGLRPDARELVELRNHGVPVELLKAMADSGFRVTDAKHAVQLQIHGVSADFVREVRELGYKLTPDDLVQFRIHGVDAKYLRKIAAAGYENLTPEKIVKLRVHGVD